jgi:hypothetical protein
MTAWVDEKQRKGIDSKGLMISGAERSLISTLSVRMTY